MRACRCVEQFRGADGVAAGSGGGVGANYGRQLMGQWNGERDDVLVESGARGEMIFAISLRLWYLHNPEAERRRLCTTTTCQQIRNKAIK